MKIEEEKKEIVDKKIKLLTKKKLYMKRRNNIRLTDRQMEVMTCLGLIGSELLTLFIQTILFLLFFLSGALVSEKKCNAPRLWQVAEAQWSCIFIQTSLL